MLKNGEPGDTKPPISFEMRMAVVYRLEKKKIFRSQINLIEKVRHVLKHAKETLIKQNKPDSSYAYQALILEETVTEKDWREACAAQTDIEEGRKAKELAMLEERFYCRRMINCHYFKEI